MSTPLAKRRRLDVASSTLSKPFRSPFKTPLKTNSITTKAASEPSNQETPLVHKTTSITPSYKPVINKTIHQFSPQVSTPTSTLRKKATTTRGRFASPLVTATLNTDPEITSLIKKQRELEKKLRELKEELDVAEQARKIEVKSEKKGDKEVDGELKELVGKWKSASRGAAEDLFGGVKDRINKAGGPRAWKESMRRQQEAQAAWEAEGEVAERYNPDNDESDEDDDEETKMEKRKRREIRDACDYEDQYDSCGEDVETELERGQRVGNVVIDDGPEDEYTMGEMLKTLNVPIEVIGYDVEGQRWID